MAVKVKKGSTYLVNHCRKGSFQLAVNSQDDEWIHGVIAEGQAGAMMSYNEKFEGDEITVRKSLLTSAELVKA